MVQKLKDRIIRNLHDLVGLLGSPKELVKDVELVLRAHQKAAREQAMRWELEQIRYPVEMFLMFARLTAFHPAPVSVEQIEGDRNQT